MEWVWRTRVAGPLAPYADGLRLELLARLGYTHSSAENRVWMMGHLSRWLTGEGLEPSDLSQDRIAELLTVFGAEWTPPLTEGRLAPIVSWLRDRNVVPPLTNTRRNTPHDQLLERYHDWLVEDRCLAARTIGRYEATVRHFLEAHQRAGRTTGVEGLSGADVTAFLLGECWRLAVGSARGGLPSCDRCCDSCIWKA